MKILLLGEFSGLHKNLKEGLIELGHEVHLASQGDGWKKIEGDINLNVEGNFFSRGIKRIKQKFELIKLVRNYDVVQLMNPFIFYIRIKLYPNFLNILFFKKLISNSKKFFMLAAGDDSYFWKVGRYKLAYGPFEDFLKYDLGGQSRYFMESDRAFEFNKFIADNCHGIIPVAYEYAISYEGHKNLLNPIPLPINTNKIKYEENKIGKKIVVFHGLNRYGFKGTKYVEKAFEILRQKYPNKLELIIDGKLPLDKYLNLLRRSNIVVDQTNSYSVGMNALYAMAMGKVVLGGAEPEALKFLGIEKSPVINIKPNADSIVKAIEFLIHNPEIIGELSLQSRKYVEEVHGHIKVAEKFVNTWSSIKCAE